MTIDAVLFDLDGTLVDSEPIWAVAEQDLAVAHGVEWTHDDIMHIRGWALIDGARYLMERGVDLDPPTIIDQLEATVNRQLRESLPWTQPGMRILAQCADRGIPTAIVTMSRRSGLDIVLDGLPTGHVEFSVAGDEVANGKPDPEPYLRAAAALGVDPTSCAVLEDSVTGSTAGLRAGCQVAVVGALRGTIPGTIGLEPDADLDQLLAALSRR